MVHRTTVAPEQSSVTPASEDAAPKKKRDREPTFDPTYIRDLSEKVYRIRLDQECAGNVYRMLAKDAEEDPADGGKKLRNRAGQYDPLTRAYLEVFGFTPGGKSNG